MVLGDRTVPEDKDLSQQRDTKTQIAELRARLTGHEQFAKWRGQLDPIVELIECILDHAGSPTDALREYDMLVAAGRPFVTMLAKSMRDGDFDAHSELKAALSCREFVFTGEELPIDQTVPVTVVMPVPEIAKAMLRALHKNFLWSAVYNRDSWRTHVHDQLSEQETELRDKLLELLPGNTLTPGQDRAFELAFSFLYKHAKLALPTWKRLDLSEWPFIHWLRPHSVYKKIDTPEGAGYREAISAWSVKSPNVNNGAVIGHMAVMIQAEQSDVLKKLGDRHADVATWQLRIPKPVWGHRVAGAKVQSRVLFYEEGLHAENQAKYPTYTSKGLSGGMGTLFGEIQGPINTVFPDDINISSLNPFFCLLV